MSFTLLGIGGLGGGNPTGDTGGNGTTYIAQGGVPIHDENINYTKGTQVAYQGELLIANTDIPAGTRVDVGWLTGQWHVAGEPFPPTFGVVSLDREDPVVTGAAWSFDSRHPNSTISVFFEDFVTITGDTITLAEGYTYWVSAVGAISSTKAINNNVGYSLYQNGLRVGVRGAVYAKDTKEFASAPAEIQVRASQATTVKVQWTVDELDATSTIGSDELAGARITIRVLGPIP